VAKRLGADVARKSRTPREIFGLAITDLRVASGMSQTSLAASLGYSTYYLGRIERGKANVTCDVMAAVSSYFNMSIGQFWIYAEKLARKSSGKK
jgi:transcriptional regulator with XRE-family HTH domain